MDDKRTECATTRVCNADGESPGGGEREEERARLAHAISDEEPNVASTVVRACAKCASMWQKVTILPGNTVPCDFL